MLVAAETSAAIRLHALGASPVAANTRARSVTAISGRWASAAICLRSRIAVGESLPSTSRQARASLPASRKCRARVVDASSSSRGGSASAIEPSGTPSWTSRRSAVLSQAVPRETMAALSRATANNSFEAVSYSRRRISISPSRNRRSGRTE
jgi:hypothetical protein